MRLPLHLRHLVAAGAVLLGMNVAVGQGYPSKPIRIVAPEAGGGADLAARIVAAGLSGAIGQQAIVENRGGSAIIPAEIVAKSAPDGHTLLFSANAHWLLPLFQDNVPYDAIRDYAPITLTTTSPAIIAVHPSLPVKSLKELVALAKARPGVINCASGTTGSTTYLSAELFRAMAGVNITTIPFKGAAPALNAAVGGQVDMIVITASSVMPHVRNGRLRALAVASAQPSELAPGVTTAAVAGLPGFESGTTHGLFAPARTPEAIVTRLNQEIVRYLGRPETRERIFNSGLEMVGSTPAELMATVKNEIARIAAMLKRVGVNKSSG